MIWFFTKLQYFSTDQAIFLIYTLTQSNFNKLDSGEQENYKYLFSKIDSTTSVGMLKEITDAVSKSIIRKIPLVVYDVNEGGNFSIIVKKQDTNDDYTAYILVARNSQTNTILAQKDAANTETQSLNFDDLNLTENKIYKIRIQLEEDSGAGTTNNEAVAELTTFFLVVANNIDSE